MADKGTGGESSESVTMSPVLVCFLGTSNALDGPLHVCLSR